MVWNCSQLHDPNQFSVQFVPLRIPQMPPNRPAGIVTVHWYGALLTPLHCVPSQNWQTPGTHGPPAVPLPDPGPGTTGGAQVSVTVAGQPVPTGVPRRDRVMV